MYHRAGLKLFMHALMNSTDDSTVALYNMHLLSSCVDLNLLHLISKQGQLDDQLYDVIRPENEVATPLRPLYGQLDHHYPVSEVTDQDAANVGVPEVLLHLEVVCIQQVAVLAKQRKEQMDGPAYSITTHICCLVAGHAQTETT